MDMLVRPSRQFSTNRSKELPKVEQSSQPMVYPAPLNGLVTTISMTEAAEGSASIATNWFPTMQGMRIRGGSVRRAVLVNPAPVVSMFTYKFGANQKMFAATATAIYDISSPPAPPATTPVQVGGLTSGEWMTFQHTTTGGSFLCAFNGTDDRRVYDGTAWATTPAITFADSTLPSQIGAAFLFKQRQFLIKSGTFDAYYLGVNSIGGAATVFPLGGVMKQGGGLLTGWAWSLESGDGLNVQCCFMSTEGEIAVYEGDDPSVATSWSLKGVYSIPRPLGKNAFIRAGADILIATVSGLIPLSSVFQRSRDTIIIDAISRPIDKDWRRCVAAVSYGWSLTLWPETGLVFISFPFTVVEPDTTFVLNIKTSKWSIVSNWQARAYASLQGSLFFGDTNGVIWNGDASGADDGKPFKATYLSHFMSVGGFGRRAQATLAHMYFRGKVNPIVMLFARANGNVTDPAGPAVTQSTSIASEWDVGKWDEALWDAGGLDTTKIQRRQNVRATGDTLALGCVVTSGGSAPLGLELDMGVLQVAGGRKLGVMKHHYTIAIEPFDEALKDCEPLARLHYEEMRSRLAGQGIPIGPYNPRLDVYRRAAEAGYLFTFVVRTEDGEAVGYSNVYLQTSMHSREPYAREDTVYVRPDHRNGVGRRLVKFILDHMKAQGAKRFEIQPVTDLRVGKIWKRMGFRTVSENMTLVY